MSVSFNEVAPRDETTALRERLSRLKGSLSWAKAAIPESVIADVNEAITRCEERLQLGVHHTVIALAGGTGSGKSTLFNVIAGQDFAIPGVARPTTAHVSAAAWGEAAALLRWMQVVSDHQLLIDPAGDHAKFAGLVLLDLPDHDSVEVTNRDIVDRIVPRADLVVWVVDPQKYADFALHHQYLKVASAHGQPALVVLNQTDRLATGDAWAVAQDLLSLLATDGLPEVQVIPVSARTGEGIDVLLAEVARAVSSRSVSARAVRADLVAAGRALAQALAKDTDPVLPDVEHLVNAFMAASGADARVEATFAVSVGTSKVLPDLSVPALSVVDQERHAWIDEATSGLPRTWHTVLDYSVESAEQIQRNLEGEFAKISWPEVSKVTGWHSAVTKRLRANGRAKEVRELIRNAIVRALRHSVVEPTQTVHQAYRVLDELTELPE